MRGYLFYLKNAASIFGNRCFEGWGRKRTGRFAAWCQYQFGGKLSLFEDGFIRSLGLGTAGSPSFSIVVDDTGIYYDATTPSKLENILNTYDFEANTVLMEQAREAIKLICKHHISKYNNGFDLPDGYFAEEKSRILIVAQTQGDASLAYGMADTFSTDAMIDSAIAENPNAQVYLKLHPDVLSGEKSSDIDIANARKNCIIIDENINPIALLEHFDTVYTKTSQMGFEALLLGKKCVCFGMPFYAGWGITDDRIACERRKKIRSVEEVFAAAYILYTRYTNPYTHSSSDIIDTIREIIRQRQIRKNRPVNDAKRRILAIGDSHIRVFEHHYFRLFFPNTEFKIVYVPGATVSGIRNINSLTRAYTIFKEALDEGGYDEIIITLGEVDAAYAIWKRAEAHKTDVEKILDDVVAKYQEFLLALMEFAPTTVISAPLQTISDCRECADETSKVRSSIDISIEERTAKTLEFNRRIKVFCTEKGIGYLDFDTVSLGKNGILKSWLINPKNPCDHHYRRWVYALMIILKMKMGRLAQ